MGKTRCIVPGFGVLTNKYQLPSYDVKIREEWLKRCGAPNKILSQDKVCPKHFDVACIIISNGRLFLEYVQTCEKRDNFMFLVSDAPSNETPKTIGEMSPISTKKDA